ncbi:MAG: hypothetical protein GY853_01525 [PVC group bacterium]|nr:hypothetical protein [PVC group bacterium]
MELKNEKMKCNNCGRLHNKQTSNCCWIECACGASICGKCGSVNIMEMDSKNDEEQYWCCLQCTDCGLEGCEMCI